VPPARDRDTERNGGRDLGLTEEADDRAEEVQRGIREPLRGVEGEAVEYGEIDRQSLTDAPAATGWIGGGRRGRLGEVVADVAEDVLELIAKEDHCDDHGDRDDGDDECIFDETLAVLFPEERVHTGPPFPIA
jgi:hypothetical protein